MRYAAGIDISTTGVKAVLVDEAGDVRAAASQEHDLHAPRPLWAEQNPADWWKGTCAVLRVLAETESIDASDIGSIGLSGQMHGLVLVDATGEILRPAILWNDQRTGAECDEIRDSIGRSRLLKLTGNDALTGLTLPKLLWVAKHEPETYARIAQVLLPKDYIRYRLTGEFATDKAGAAGTLMMDLSSRDWSSEILSTFSIPRNWLPPTFEGPEVTGVLSASAARETGLAVGTPVVAGAGDQAAQAVGVGAIAPGEVAVTIGTSGVVFCPTDTPRVDSEGRLQAFCHGLPERWHLMGVMLSAAGSLRWFRDTFAPDQEYASLVEGCRDIPPGADGLIFLPYLCGERMPYADPLMRGGFVGLTTRHRREHLIRALIEGVSFGLRDGLELLRAWCGSPIESVRVSGGGAKSFVWRQILSDTLKADVVRVNAKEGAAFGAALLGGVGGGLWASVPEACQQAVRTLDRTEPREAYAARYDQVFELYRAGYPACRTIAHRLSALESEAPGPKGAAS